MVCYIPKYVIILGDIPVDVLSNQNIGGDVSPASPAGLTPVATPSTYFLHLFLSSVILIDSSTGSPVHVLMLSTQAVSGLPRLRAPGIVPQNYQRHIRFYFFVFLFYTF